MRHAPIPSKTEYKDKKEVPNGQIRSDFFSSDSQSNIVNDSASLPIWGLSDNVQKIIEEVTEGYQCNRDYALAGMMGAASAILGKKASSRFYNFKNYPNLWIAIVGNSSAGKTEPVKFFFAPIEELERKSYKAYLLEKRVWESDTDDNGEKPEYRHLVINNPTDESVFKELSVNGSICWKSDELATIFGGWGKYSKSDGNIVGNILSTFNYQDISITRVHSEPIYIKEPNLSIIGGIQPRVLKQEMRRRFMYNGLFPRFLYVFPESGNVPLFKESVISNDSIKQWTGIIEKLDTLLDTSIEETGNAKKIHESAINMWRIESNQYSDNDIMQSVLGKLEIHLCRWSIIVALLSGKTVIDEDVIKYSIDCMNYFKYCAEKAFVLIANDECRKISSKDAIITLNELYGGVNQTKMAEALGISQPAISKMLNSNN